MNGNKSYVSNRSEEKGHSDEKRKYSSPCHYGRTRHLNKTQIETWWRWYRNREEHRLVQPIGKQYTFGKGPEGLSEKDQLIQENKYLKMQVALLKKYQKMGRE